MHQNATISNTLEMPQKHSQNMQQMQAKKDAKHGKHTKKWLKIKNPVGIV